MCELTSQKMACGHRVYVVTAACADCPIFPHDPSNAATQRDTFSAEMGGLGPGSHAGNDVVYEFVFTDSYDLNVLDTIPRGYMSLANYLSDAVRAKAGEVGLVGNVLCRSVYVRRNVLGSESCVACRRRTFRHV